MREAVGLYALSLGLGTPLSLALAAYGWRRRRLVPGGAAFAAFNLGVAVWTGVHILGVNATGPAAVFWANMAYFGIGLVPASWLVFAIRYSGRDWRITHRSASGSRASRWPGDCSTSWSSDLSRPSGVSAPSSITRSTRSR